MRRSSTIVHSVQRSELVSAWLTGENVKEIKRAVFRVTSGSNGNGVVYDDDSVMRAMTTVIQAHPDTIDAMKERAVMLLINDWNVTVQNSQKIARWSQGWRTAGRMWDDHRGGFAGPNFARTIDSFRGMPKHPIGGTLVFSKTV
jgi:hypothetical protein